MNSCMHRTKRDRERERVCVCVCLFVCGRVDKGEIWIDKKCCVRTKFWA